MAKHLFFRFGKCLGRNRNLEAYFRSGCLQGFVTSCANNGIVSGCYLVLQTKQPSVIIELGLVVEHKTLRAHLFVEKGKLFASSLAVDGDIDDVSRDGVLTEHLTKGQRA